MDRRGQSHPQHLAGLGVNPQSLLVSGLGHLLKAIGFHWLSRRGFQPRLGGHPDDAGGGAILLEDAAVAIRRPGTPRIHDDMADMVADAPGALINLAAQDESSAHTRPQGKAKHDFLITACADPGFPQRRQVRVIFEDDFFGQFFPQIIHDPDIFPIEIRGIDNQALFGVQGAGGSDAHADMGGPGQSAGLAGRVDAVRDAVHDPHRP